MRVSRVGFIAFILLTFCSLYSLGLAEDSQGWGGVSHKFEHTIQSGYNINIISPKAGQKFKPGQEVNIEISVEGATSPTVLIMLGSAMETLKGNHIITKLKLDDKYTGESEVMITVNSKEGFIGSKAIKIFIGNKESSEGPKWDEGRDINELEWAYIGIAKDMRSPEMCYRISPKATYGAGFAPAGHQMQYARSICFSLLAYELKNKNLCDEVKSISTPYADGSALSKYSCIRAIDNNDHFADYAWGFDTEKLLKKIGYSETDIPDLYRKNGSIDYFSFYLYIINTEDFQQRLKSLPDFSKD